MTPTSIALHAVEHLRQHEAEAERGDEAEADADERQPHALAHDEAEHVGAPRAERHADADLARAAGDRVRHDRVEPHHREEQADEALDRRHGRAHPERHEPEDAVLTCAVHRLHVEDRQVGIEVVQHAA